MARLKVNPLSSLMPMITVLVFIAVLYFAREIFIPFSLALLFAFILTPVVRQMEALRLGRTVSVIIVSLFSLILTGAVAWAVVNQLVDVVGQLPKYKENIHQKAQAIMSQKTGGLSEVTNNVQELSKELKTSAPDQTPPVAPRHPAKSARGSSAPQTTRPPLPVEIVEPPPNALQSIRNFAGPLLGPLGTAGIVIVFTIFLLIEREDVRNRLFRLAGQSQIHLITNALDDAAQRVSRYLFLQLLVNCGFGVIIGAGLFFIGIPNALLWAVLGAILRFVPYVGPLVAGAFPLVLALAVSNGWKEPILTFGLFLVTELTVGNLVEPKLYGSHTGISSLAILVAAVFWTVLWGPIGLLLSTPLTVCLVVLGRHVPQLEFLNIILGDQPALPPEALFYQRLLALDQQEARAVVDLFLKTGSLLDLYETVMIPALSMAEHDRHSGILDEARESFVFQSVSEIVVELGATANDSGAPRIVSGKPRIVCVPAHDAADEITMAMLAQVAELEGYPVISISLTESSTELVHEIANLPDDVVCVSALPPFALLHASKLSRALRARIPDRKIVVGVWGSTALGQGTESRVERAFAGPVVTRLADALAQFAAG